MNKRTILFIFSFFCFSWQIANGWPILVKNSYTEAIKVYKFNIGGDPSVGSSITIDPGESCVLKYFVLQKHEVWVAPVSRFKISNRGHYTKVLLDDLGENCGVEITGFNFADDGQVYARESLMKGIVAKFAALAGLGAKLRQLSILFEMLDRAVVFTKEVDPAMTYSSVAAGAVSRKGAIDVQDFMRSKKLMDSYYCEQFALLYDISELRRAKHVAQELNPGRYAMQLSDIENTCDRAILLREQRGVEG